MEKRIIYKTIEGGIHIVIPAPRIDLKDVINSAVPSYRFFQKIQQNETDKQAKERLGVKDLDKKLDHKIIDAGQIPEDKTFRDAWDIDGNGIKVDMKKARNIHMSRIREARNAALQKLDIEQLQGKDVSGRKQHLRDVPKKFDLTAAKTAEELKNLWPEELKDFK